MAASDVDVLAETMKRIGRRDVPWIGAALPLVREIVSKQRNKAMIWEALIDETGKLFDTKKPDPFAMMGLFLSLAGFSPSDSLGSRGSALQAGIARSPFLGLWLLSRMPSPNASLSSGVGAAEAIWREAAKGHEKVGLPGLVRQLFAIPGFDPKFNDQGVRIMFDLVPWLMTNTPPVDMEDGLAALSAVIGSGVDVNSPRAMPNKMDSARPIYTVLAYSLKRLSWSGTLGRHPQSRRAASEYALAMIEMGADPCLQMAKTERVELLDIVRSGGFERGMAEAMESRLMDSCLSEAGASESAVSEVKKNVSL